MYIKHKYITAYNLGIAMFLNRIAVFWSLFFGSYLVCGWVACFRLQGSPRRLSCLGELLL